MSDIAVILTVWKRNNLSEQLQRIIRQTEKPSRIIIFQNENHLTIDIPEDVKTKHNVQVIQSKDFNFKFHGRFTIPLILDSEYCAIFDDDTMPNKNWLKNCLETSKRLNCIVGANGRNLSKEGRYLCFGDGAAVEQETKVDFVGHCWFFKTEWIRNMWRDKHFSYENGEDIHLAASCKVHQNIDCYVPRMPTKDESCWGDTQGWLGMDEHASYKKNEHQETRHSIITSWVKKGWKLTGNTQLDK
tara:strand:+ start:752 stop:1483 length:732 start_codon:yes stop_codon:yes gene_type:complete